MVPSGSEAIIHRVGDAAPFYTTVRDGGFDPVPVGAQPGDFIAIIVKDAAGGTVLQAHLAVAAARPPIVVRTDPPRKKTDVPVNAALAFVFSEPVAGGTLTQSSIQLFRGTTPVAGSVRLLEGTATAAVFVPSTPLDPNTAYRLEVTRAVQDLEGDALAAGVTMDFTTGQSSTGPAASITLSPDTVFMTGATYQLTATVRDAAGNLLIDQPITWSTDDPAGLTVSPTGLLTALAAGPYHVAATVNGLTAEVLVLVSVGPAASVAVSPAQTTVGAAGDTIILTAIVRDAAGRLLAHPSVTWTSSDVAVATAVADSAANAGRAFATVTSVSPGSVTITATSGTASGTASVTVVPPPPVASVTLAPDSAMLVVQATRQLSAAVRDANGKVLAGRPITWTTDNAAVATVDADGLVTGVSVGAAAVSATSEGLSDTAAITVTLISFGSVTAGGHACGVTTMGAAYCWGAGSSVPAAVTGGLMFSTLSVGQATCGITTTGVAYCWGDNGGGGFGNGSTTSSAVPVPAASGLSLVSVSGTISSHACGVTGAGTGYCWGVNESGQLGTGSNTGPEQCWGQMPCSTTPLVVVGGLTFSALSAGGGHTCGVTTTGAAYCWGQNGGGSLGDGSTIDRYSPVAVTGGLTFSALTAGWGYTCGLTTNGTAYCWGVNSGGQLGIGSSTGPQQCGDAPCSTRPLAVAGGLTFSALSAGGSHTCGVTTTGAAYCWGYNDHFQLGAPISQYGSATPVAVSGGLTFASLSAGVGYSCGVTVNSVAYCWGANWQGQLGNGTTSDSAVPVKVAGQP